MFDEVTGLPVHVLVVHAVVVLLPLTALAAITYALVPRWRAILRWPMPIGAILSLGFVYAAEKSGGELFAGRAAELRGAELAAAVAHEEQGELLLWYALAFFAVSLISALLLSGAGHSTRAQDRKGATKPLQFALAALLVVVAAGTGYQTVVTGHGGSRAVWGAEQ
ncbi:hypothetical protein FB570_11721 [Streptomyces sp. T12]|uniref:DUF2231 domain-containing protein n=1 Tax=Streptomyces sp. T12 TaxID=477697 RepID=UPI0011AA4922|nr:DUF2231 domain-containing protein [Streptomyces sp. T12]TWD13529.1 hypothetical protein FB570_11721 [Streptomyces sp. T12]